MPWYAYPASFFGGAFAANALLHLFAGVSRRRFPTPFASPPFTGLSSPAVNLAWGMANLALAYLLLVRVVAPSLSSWIHVVVGLVGFILMGRKCVQALARERERHGNTRA